MPSFLVVEVKKECTAAELIREYGRNPEVYYVVRDERVLRPGDRLKPGDRVAIIPLIAGGS
ncbi:MAG: MoaD/ThiS family protein [Aigarchaeota archaeon]|nr:MoaD/ThiS family protein [Candidatus Pelearchaeum maunauluense]